MQRLPMNPTEIQKKAIDKTMKWFDFEVVHKTMVALDWKWSDYQRVPTLEEIKEHARKLMERAIEEKCRSYLTGGLKVNYYPENDKPDCKEPMITLEFVISWWDQSTNDL
jgi:hypothetical protein